MTVRCDGWCEQAGGEVAYIDESGFAYCTGCGQRRQADGWKRCRKLRPHELRRLQRGEQLVSY
jgi:hypothetical protein